MDEKHTSHTTQTNCWMILDDIMKESSTQNEWERIEKKHWKEERILGIVKWEDEKVQGEKRKQNDKSKGGGDKTKH